jgi:ABC-type lipoprotein export system ATPase subunit
MLSAVDVFKTYTDTGRPLAVLKNVSLDIQPGDLVALTGPSGAGKSTLLHLLGGLDHPTQGKVILDGKDLYKLNDLDRARVRNQKIGFVFQFYHLLPEFTVLDNVVLPALIKGFFYEKKRYEQQARVLIDQVGLSSRSLHKPKQLSGGEQQRVAIARALMNKPDFVLCDEPTGNLDSQTGHDIIDLLVALNKDHHQSVVIVTHDKEIAQRAQRTIYLQDGELTE